ncbi:MAG TPA: helix-turn-helix domain-containing protein [Streptosporangiaceae bacterium]|jgi:DNA-binding NarL/FixJ family response regulator
MAASAETQPLSDDDVVLLKLLADGLPIEAVARRMRTSERTVRRRTRQICDRLQVGAPIQAVVWAAHRGVL